MNIGYDIEERLELDRVLYGTSFAILLDNGDKVRIDPRRVEIKRNKIDPIKLQGKSILESIGIKIKRLNGEFWRGFE